MEEIKKREVIKRIKVKEKDMWFMQAMLEDINHLVAISLGEKDTLTIFYDALVEEDVEEYLNIITNFVNV